MKQVRISFTMNEAEVEVLKKYAVELKLPMAGVIRATLRRDEFLGDLLWRAREIGMGDARHG